MLFLSFLAFAFNSQISAQSPSNIQQVPSNPPHEIILEADSLILVPNSSRAHPIRVTIVDVDGLPPSPQSSPVTVTLTASGGQFVDSNQQQLVVTIGVSDGWRATIFYRTPDTEGRVNITANATGLIGDFLTFYLVASTSGVPELEVQVNATTIDVREFRVVEVLALLVDAKDQILTTASGIPVTFFANGSRYRDSSSFTFTTSMENGIARGYLMVPSVEMVVNVTVSIDSIRTTSTFIHFFTSSSVANEESEDKNDNEMLVPGKILDPVGSLIDGTSQLLMSSPIAIISLLLISAVLVVMLLMTARVTGFPFLKFRNADEKDENVVSWTERILLSFIGILGAISTSRWFRRIDFEDVLENDFRRKIITILQRVHVSHLRRLQKELNCGTSILLWHLEILEDFGYVEKTKIGQYIIYYLAHQRPSSDYLKAYLSLLNESSKKIIQVLLTNPSLNVDQIGQLTGLHRKTIKYNVKRLQKLGVIIKNENDQVNENSFSLNIHYVPIFKKFLDSAAA